MQTGAYCSILTVQGFTVTQETRLTLALNPESILITTDKPIFIRPGYKDLAGRYFNGTLPDGRQLEVAIMVVEDALAPVRDSLPKAARLDSRDPAVTAIAALCGIGAPPAVLSRAAVEQLYARLARVAEGRPPASEGWPVDAELAAQLLIVRELLHHFDFDAIHLP